MTDSEATESTPQVVVVCAADAGYVMPLAVMLHSAAANLSPDATLLAYVVGDGIPSREKERLEELSAASDIALHWLDAEAISDLPIWGRMPRTTYHRLTIARLLPATVSKAIWLDCDLVVMSDLVRLWGADLAGHPLLAAQDVLVPFVSSPLGIRRWRELGLPRDAPYFNAGVMVVDLAAWRASEIESEVVAYLRASRDQVIFWDQEGLNAVVCGRWGRLDDRWNQNASVVGRPFFRPQHLDPATHRSLLADPWIVHFSGNLKPWLLPGDGGGPRSLYYRHLDLTPWAGWRPRRTVASVLAGAYESSRLRNVLYPAEAWGMRLLRRWTLRGERR